jgi:hypothetical protein
MAKKMDDKAISGIGVAGFSRLKIIDHNQKTGAKKVVGDSGWCKNLVTNLGFQHYILESMGTIAGSSAVESFALGEGTAPGAAATSLQSELTDGDCRFNLTPSVVSSKTLQMVGTLASGVITTTHDIKNIGVFAVSTTELGSILCGNTYATSNLQTNQSVNVTYQLRFSTA